jgi:hypothetical protein
MAATPSVEFHTPQEEEKKGEEALGPTRKAAAILEASLRGYLSMVVLGWVASLVFEREEGERGC